MARKTVKRKPAGSAKPPQAHTPSASRRDTLKGLMWWGAGGAALLGGGAVFAMDFRKKLAEHDLSVIGQGVPVILQIHDPQCSLCAALQKQTRSALRAFDDHDVLFRVANVRTTEGAARQQAEGLPHVTLVLYDGEGHRVHVVEGVTQADVLVETFKRHLGLTPARAL